MPNSKIPEINNQNIEQEINAFLQETNRQRSALKKLQDITDEQQYLLDSTRHALDSIRHANEILENEIHILHNLTTIFRRTEEDRIEKNLQLQFRLQYAEKDRSYAEKDRTYEEKDRIYLDRENTLAEKAAALNIEKKSFRQEIKNKFNAVPSAPNNND